MIPKLDSHFGVRTRLEDEDISKVIEVMRMIESPGWKVLESYYVQIREMLLNKGKLGVLVKDSDRRSDIIFGVLSGFDSFKNLPEQLNAELKKRVEEKEEPEVEIDE